MRHSLLLLVSMTISGAVFAQGVTTSSLSGRIMDENKEPLPGATVRAVHQPTGTQYGSVTGIDGYYRIANMRVGGPYRVTVNFVGYEEFVKSDINLQLGRTFVQDVTLSESVVTLKEAVVTANPTDIIDSEKTGQSTVIDQELINNLPTVSRAIGDYVRFNPLADISENQDGFSISLSGQNNRFNTIYIDGAVSNDVFGLAGSGTNGGQTGVQPISIDAIEQFQVAVAPFDVRQSGFAGGAINAVTRSGSNEIEGSAYFFLRNEDLAGDTPSDEPDWIVEREKLDDFSAKTYGLRLGGPIIQDKLFYFVNVELQRDETPHPFNFETYQGSASRDQIDQLISKLRNDFNYDPGTFTANQSFLESDKILAKLDWNLNKNHSITLRHSYVQAENLEARRSNTRTINFQNGSEFFTSTTNSTALEVRSILSPNISNKLTIGATIVRDDRDPLGEPFPTVELADGSNASINLGAERFSTANLLKQDAITLNNDLEIYRGKHSFLVGLNVEYFNAGNLFIRNNFGRYRYFNSGDMTGLEKFLADEPADRFERGFSQVDNVTGDESDAIAEFSQYMVGLYFQDQIQLRTNFNLTAGLRIDVPVWPDDQPLNRDFNQNTIPLIRQAGYDLKGARTGEFIDPQILFAPRVGFNWDVDGEKRTQVRGGLGIFTSRIPLVWPGGAYNNYGLNIGEFFARNVSFNPNINEQPPGEIDPNAVEPSGQIDLFAEDFKLPQVFKINLALDKRFSNDWIITLEGLYSKNINAVQYQNLNLKPSTRNLEGADNRPIWDGINPAFGGDPVDPTYSGIYLASNTDKGYTYNLAASVTKLFDNGFNANLSYSYGDAFSLFDATSSQNSSQWRSYFNVEGRNFEREAQRSIFATGHRIIGNLSYEVEYLGFAKSTFSLVYNGESGDPFTYVIGARNFEIVDDGGFGFNEFAYIPRNQGEIVLVEETIVGVTYTPDQQWRLLNSYIENDEFLSENRGEYAERNQNRLPFQSILDFRFLQDFYIEMANGKRNTLQLSVDIFNFTNLLNNRWGRIYFMPFNTFSLVNFEGFLPNSLVPTYSVNENILEGTKIYENNIDDSGFRSSRWQMQVGVRYIFGN
jgi:hypothetical protein